MYILGLETSCDETSAAIVSDKKEIVTNILFSQLQQHKEFGGVVPEIASRAHLQFIEQIIREATAQISLKEIEAIAVTRGPGLIGGLIVGLMVAKSLAYALRKPLIGINHLEAHALTARLVYPLEFPFMLLLISGGHCQLLEVKNVGSYRKLGGTIDDAAGEAFDKVAKMLGLDYPGGPIIEKYARLGDARRFQFPQPLSNKPDCNFSFSGLKTAVRRKIEEFAPNLNEVIIADIAASFQYTVAEILCDRIKNALTLYIEPDFPNRYFVLAGGVAANQYIRNRLEQTLAQYNFTLIAPPIALCTDNAAMVAWAGIEHYKRDTIYSLDIEPRARWPLEE